MNLLIFYKLLKKSDSYEYKNKSARRGAQFAPIGMPTTCWNSVPPKETNMLSMRNSFTVYYKCESCRELWMVILLTLLLYCPCVYCHSFYVIELGLFGWKRIIVCWYIYCSWRSAYQVEKVGIQLTGWNPPHL